MFRRQEKAQITVETSIVLPIVIMVVAGFIYVSFYIHDIISIRSRVYSVGIEYGINGKNDRKTYIDSHLFVIRPQVIIEEQLNNYCIKIKYAGKGNINLINKMISKKETDYIKIQKTMSREVLYSNVAINTVMDKGKQ